MSARIVNRAQNLQQQWETKAWKKAKEAHSRERQVKWDKYQRRGLNPNTPSTQTSSIEDEDEDEDGNKVDSEAAYEVFFAIVGRSGSGPRS